MQFFYDWIASKFVFEIIFKNNTFINHTFGKLGLIHIYRADIYNLTVVLEDTYFENITNAVNDWPVITVIGDNVKIRNTTFKNSKVSTALSVTGMRGEIEKLLI